MIKTYITSVLLLISLIFAAVTSARFIQDTDERDKRQIGDLRTAEYLALIGLKQILPSHCEDLACGLVDVIASGKRKKRDLSYYLSDTDSTRRLNLLNLLLQNNERQFS